MCPFLQAMDANLKLGWQQFWVAAKVRLEQLGYSNDDIGLLKGRLLHCSQLLRTQYFEGDDEEVLHNLNSLLMQPAGKCCVRKGPVLAQDSHVEGWQDRQEQGCARSCRIGCWYSWYRMAGGYILYMWIYPI